MTPPRSLPWARLAPLAAMLVGIALGVACGNDEDPRLCSAEAVGEPGAWLPVGPDAVPECAEPPPPVLSMCFGDLEGGANGEAIHLDDSGVIAAAGRGEPPPDGCSHFLGSYLDEVGAHRAPFDDLQWIEVDLGGDRWLLSFRAANDATSPAVGDRVSVWLEWDPSDLSVDFELRDASDDTLWWLHSDLAIEGIDYTPHCLPIRLGAPQCTVPGICGSTRFHAVEVDGVAVPVGGQAVVDGLRFSNEVTADYEDDECTERARPRRMIGATRED